MKNFATDEMPIRASNLPRLYQCPRSFVVATIKDGEDDGEEPAHTGSLIHFGIQMYHSSKESKSAAMVALRQGQELWPKADPERAATHVTGYITREREEQRGVIIHSEVAGKITLPCAKWDTTKKPITIKGTIDQIRKLGDWYYVVDFKSGFRPGAGMVQYHTPQLAAYMLCGAKLVESNNVKGFIARTEDLKSRQYPYWWEMPFNLDGATKILQTVAELVGVIRMGGMPTAPGKHCDYCKDEYNYPGCVLRRGQKRLAKVETIAGTKRTPLKTVSELFK